jgi:ribonuclease III
MQTLPPVSELEARISYRFRNVDLLDEAVRHSSYVNEFHDADLKDNERLEFLGDAVLNLVVGHILLERHPGTREGDLSRMRASLVNETQLAALASDLNLGAFIRLGKGEVQTGGQAKTSILAGALEALMAAVYLDGGFESAFELASRHFGLLIHRLDAANGNADFKSQLQEWAQARPAEMPSYAIIRDEGPDHDKTFWVRLTVAGIATEGVGKSKKAAEQDAAAKALEILTRQSG